MDEAFLYIAYGNDRTVIRYLLRYAHMIGMIMGYEDHIYVRDLHSGFTDASAEVRECSGPSGIE